MTGKQLLKKFEKAAIFKGKNYKLYKKLMIKFLKELGNVHIDKLGTITRNNNKLLMWDEKSEYPYINSKCSKCNEDISPQGSCACTGYFIPLGPFNRNGPTCDEYRKALGDDQGKAMGIPATKEIFEHWKIRKDLYGTHTKGK